MKSNVRKQQVVPGSWQPQGSVATFALQMAMAEQKRLEIGARIRELREPRPQRVIADMVGVTERAYGAWERGESAIQWDHFEGLAAALEVDVAYLLNGTAAPEVNGDSQLDRIERKLDELLERSSERPGVETREPPPPRIASPRQQPARQPTRKPAQKRGKGEGPGRRAAGS